MTKTMVAVLALALLGGAATAQKVDKSGSSTVVKKVVVSKDGKTRTYKQVIKDGKVVEETGDRGLLRELDLEDLIEKAKKNGGVWSDSNSDSKKSSKKRSRRVVIKDGKKVVDEESGDLDWKELELPNNVRKMLEKFEDGTFEFEFDIGTPKIDIPHVEFDFHGTHKALPDHIKKMLNDFEVELPHIEVPHIEIPRIDIPKIDIPKIEGEVERRRPSKKGADSLQSELDELRAKMRELRKEIERLERRGR